MSTSTQEPDSPTLPEGAPDVIRDAAEGKEITQAQEREGLDWLLGPTVALEYDVTVQYETPVGMTPLVFRLRQVDGTKLDEIDAECRSGDGPFAKLDTAEFNARVVEETTVTITDLRGRSVSPKSSEFRGGVPSTTMAIKLRFGKQAGLLEGLVERVREKAGYGTDRVGTAQRALVDVGKPS
jgi:hypothetical protein